MASRAMVVLVGGVSLAEESDALQVSRNPTRVARGSTVYEKLRKSGWSLVEAPFVVETDRRDPSPSPSPGVSTGRYNLTDKRLGQRPDPMRTAPQGWVPSVALMPAGHGRGTLDMLSLYLTRRLWELTGLYDAVTYDLGSKDPDSGMVDCAGWVEYANMTIYGELDGGTKKLLHADFATLFNNGAAYLINDWDDAIGGRTTGSALDIDTMLPGTLLGIDHDPDPNGRPYDIDHIVQVVFDPVSLAPMITQSSGSGDGVNMVALDSWFTNMKETIGTSKIHAVDPYAEARGKIDAYIGTLV